MDTLQIPLKRAALPESIMRPCHEETYLGSIPNGERPGQWIFFLQRPVFLLFVGPGTPGSPLRLGASSQRPEDLEMRQAVTPLEPRSK